MRACMLHSRLACTPAGCSAVSQQSVRQQGRQHPYDGQPSLMLVWLGMLVCSIWAALHAAAAFLLSPSLLLGTLCSKLLFCPPVLVCSGTATARGHP